MVLLIITTTTTKHLIWQQSIRFTKFVRQVLLLEHTVQLFVLKVVRIYSAEVCISCTSQALSDACHIHSRLQLASKPLCLDK